MPRTRRLDYPGCWLHVMSRGARREAIFRRDQQCELFLGCLAEAVERYALEVHAYSLMPNHYHLLVRSTLGNVSRCMRQVNGTYTQRVNRLYGWDGPVFRGRFRSQVVANRVGLEHVFAYVHLNPLRAGLATRFEDNCWTSLRAYLEMEKRPEWLTTKDFATWLGGPQGIRRLVERRRKRPEEWPEEMNPETGWLKPAERQGPVRNPPTFGRRAAKRKPIAQVLERVCAIAECSLEDLRRMQRGPRANPARRFAVWALSRAGGYGQGEIGEALKMSDGQVSKVLERLRRGRAPAPLDEWMRTFLG